MNEILEKSPSTLLESNPLDQNPAAVYLASLTSSGRRSQAHALKIIASILSSNQVDILHFTWASLRYQHTMALRTKLVELYKPATVNRMICAVRGVLKNAWRLGLMGIEDYQRAADIPSVSGTTLPPGRELSMEELQSLIAACSADNTAAGVRDRAIISLMFSCGLRREEVVNLDYENYDPKNGRLLVRGKRSKERITWLVNGAKEVMDKWIDLRGIDEGPLFLAINKSGKIRAGRITSQAIYDILMKRRVAAGNRPFSPHDLRRTFVSNLMDAKIDISTIAKLAGHENVNTTMRYDRRDEEGKREALSLIKNNY